MVIIVFSLVKSLSLFQLSININIVHITINYDDSKITS